MTDVIGAAGQTESTVDRLPACIDPRPPVDFHVDTHAEVSLKLIKIRKENVQGFVNKKGKKY